MGWDCGAGSVSGAGGELGSADGAVEGSGVTALDASGAGVYMNE